MDLEIAQKFAHLHRGFRDAYGSGSGGWIKKPLEVGQFRHHLEGKGPGIGVGPLMADGTCCFAAIDLDRPDFELAAELMELLPGWSWLERSRSGNAHVLVYFESPIEAWIPRGVLLRALEVMGERAVEVFPKNDKLRVGSFGNYLNLSYHGKNRPMVAACAGRGADVEKFYLSPTDAGNGVIAKPVAGPDTCAGEFLEAFIDTALKNLNDPDVWRNRARMLHIPSPEARAQERSTDFGRAASLHRCASYIIEHRDDNPVVAGHRAAVYFMLAKCLSNWSEVDHDEAYEMMTLVNDASPDPVPASELHRILGNAERGQFTSCGCDDPLVLAYRDPTCSIGV